MEKKKQVAILLYEGVEILDVAGPAEVFGSAGHYALSSINHTLSPVTSSSGIKLMPDYTYSKTPKPDILVVPGGNTEKHLNSPDFMCALQALTIKPDYILAVCTGALFLAKIGLLDGKMATTYHTALKQLKKLAPTCEVVSDKRFVDCGRIITTAGVSAGIDGALHLIQRWQGQQAANNVAKYMEYNHWHETDGLISNYS